MASRIFLNGNEPRAMLPLFFFFQFSMKSILSYCFCECVTASTHLSQKFFFLFCFFYPVFTYFIRTQSK